MAHAELIVFALLVATVGLAVIARVADLPYPITLVLGGAVVGFVPGVPEIELEPDLVLLIFLPPCCSTRRTSRRCATCAPTPA